MKEINPEARDRYYAEVSHLLKSVGFDPQLQEDGLLPVNWQGSLLCRLTAGGGAQFREEYLEQDGGRAAFDRVSDIAIVTAEYMQLMESAPQLVVKGLEGDYRILADFNGVVLAGHPTKYGVIFDNGLRIAPEYTGQNFPTYYDKQYLMELKITPLPFAAEKSPMTLLLPTSEKRMERLLERGGYPSVEDVQISMNHSELPDAIGELLSPGNGLLELNRMCQMVERLKSLDLNRLVSAIQMACPMSASQVRHLAENLDLFEFIPNVKTPEELGRFMIQESGRFEYDPNLEGCSGRGRRDGIGAA